MAALGRLLAGWAQGPATEDTYNLRLDLKADVLTLLEEGKLVAIVVMAASVAGFALGLIAMTGGFLGVVFGSITVKLSLLGFFVARDVYVILSHLSNDVDNYWGTYKHRIQQPPSQGQELSEAESEQHIASLLKQIPKWIKESTQEANSWIITPPMISILDLLVKKSADARVERNRLAREAAARRH